MFTTSPHCRHLHWGLLATLGWTLLIALAFALLQFATLLFALPASDGPDSSDRFMTSADDGTWIALATLTTSFGCSLLILAIIRLKRGSRVADYLALRGVAPVTALHWFLLLATLMVIADAIMVWLERPVIPEFMARTYATTEQPWLLWMALVLAAPFFEELLFRGFLMRCLEQHPFRAVVLTTLPWSLLHIQYDGYGVTTVFLFGLILGAARIRTGSLPLTMAMHAFINGVATLQTALFGLD